MNLQILKDKLINGYIEYLANQSYPVFVCIDDKITEDAAYIHLTVFQVAKNKFTLAMSEDDHNAIVGKVKILRRHKIATNIPPDATMIDILQDSFLPSEDIYGKVKDMSYTLEIDEEPEVFSVFP